MKKLILLGLLIASPAFARAPDSVTDTLVCPLSAIASPARTISPAIGSPTVPSLIVSTQGFTGTWTAEVTGDVVTVPGYDQTASTSHWAPVDSSTVNLTGPATITLSGTAAAAHIKVSCSAGSITVQRVQAKDTEY